MRLSRWLERKRNGFPKARGMSMTTPNDESSTKKDSYDKENLQPVATILPWRKQPAASSPEGARVWGSARVEQIQEGSSDFIPLPVPLDEAKVRPIDKIKQTIKPGQSIETAKPKMLSPKELHRLYAGTSVPQHRYLASSLAAAANSPEIFQNPAKWLGEITRSNPSSVVDAWLNTNHNTDYEQLHSIGLDPKTGQLTAVLIVKQGVGYSGDPCTAGSREYVAFWIDWGSGFQFEGTASVVVYDFSCLPPDGLKCNVSLPVDFRTRVQHCGEEEKTFRVRAVLSWNTPSSAADPDAPVVWGNSLESRISIPLVKTIQAANRISCLAVVKGTDIARNGWVGQAIQAAINWIPPEQAESASRCGFRLQPLRLGVTLK
jgi:hypothetical protein